jgi:hypothetical protein
MSIAQVLLLYCNTGKQASKQANERASARVCVSPTPPPSNNSRALLISELFEEAQGQRRMAS